jgi:peptidyl-prolyl cis-trans isomerase SDCCAG10
MSSVYATEPATSARVIFETTHGPLDIKLWCRECPATTKLFLQLCLDGFYDDMVFHRVVPSLLIQTGALRATTTSGQRRGGETTTIMANGSGGSVWEKYRHEVQAEEALERRPYELHPRLRFNHRGQVAMALEVDGMTDVKDMQPQFFITTESAPYLDRRHVIFGTLGSGSPTMFNAIRISGVAVDETTHQPVELDQAPRITATKIVESEIHTDLLPKAIEIVPWLPIKAEDDQDDGQRQGKKKNKQKSKRKGKFDTNVLSFGDEVEHFAPLVKRPKDAIAVEEQANADSPDASARVRHDDSSFASNVVVSTTAKSDDPPETSVALGPMQVVTTDIVPARSVPPQRTVVPLDNVDDDDDKEEAAAAAAQSVADEPVVSFIEQRRARFAKAKMTKQQREDETLAKLMKFRGKLKESVVTATDGCPPSIGSSNDQDNSLAARMARRHAESSSSSSRTDHDASEAYHGQILYSDSEPDDTGGGSAWLQTRFKCKRHMDHAAREREDEYEVIDDKGKSRKTDRDRRKK